MVKFYVATIYGFWYILLWIWKIVDFAKNWLLTSHNGVKYWPMIKNRATNREYLSRAIRWFFCSAPGRLVSKRQGSHPPPLHWWRWQNTEKGRGLRLEGGWLPRHKFDTGNACHDINLIQAMSGWWGVREVMRKGTDSRFTSLSSKMVFAR